MRPAARYPAQFAARAALAGAPSSPPELLTWLAADPSPAIRLAVAGNPATPGEALLLLAADADPAVRAALARRAAAGAPGLDPLSEERPARLARALLAALARDAMAEIRAVIALALGPLPNAPHGPVLGLARDREVRVARPVLRLSPLLRTEDLLALIERPPAAFTRRQVALRPHLPPGIRQAIMTSADAGAIAALRRNEARRPPARREEILARLAAATGMTQAGIEAALAARTGRALAALCWKAGWAAAEAAALRPALGLPAERATMPNAEGGWTLGERELEWELALLEGLPG
jgi:hypothetical protein